MVVQLNCKKNNGQHKTHIPLSIVFCAYMLQLSPFQFYCSNSQQNIDQAVKAIFLCVCEFSKDLINSAIFHSKSDLCNIVKATVTTKAFVFIFFNLNETKTYLFNTSMHDTNQHNCTHFDLYVSIVNKQAIVLVTQNKKGQIVDITKQIAIKYLDPFVRFHIKLIV